jgi:BioD-like phosphotransacetylase family protein
MTKKIFIAATGQHKGKTTCTLGIAAALKTQGMNVGYCKPVGQNHIMIDDQMIDKDVVLFENILQFKTIPEIHSPVVIASGVTTQFINDPDSFNFEERIVNAAKYLEEKHDIIVYEGTGHVGVGSIVGLSNAQVAQLLNTEVILVAEGGIGNTFDRLNLNLALFRELNVPVKGVIINKVHPDKIEKVATNITLALEKINIPVLGVLPYDKALSFPLMSTIKSSIRGTTLMHPEELYKQVEDILAGSLIEIDEFTYFQNLVLIVTLYDFQSKIEKVKQTAKEKGIEGSPLSGVIITGFNKRGVWSLEDNIDMEYINKYKIPVLSTDLDTYDTVVSISQIEVKINMHTPWKVQRAIELIQSNISMDSLY